MTQTGPLYVWAISDGRIGMENQSLGLAEAISRKTNAEVHVFRVGVSSFTTKLPRWAWGDPFKALKGCTDELGQSVKCQAPWPDIFIACGRRTIPLTVTVRKKSGGGTFTVQTQDPRMRTDLFDLVVPPTHDQLEGENVFPIIGAPSRITRDAIAYDAVKLSPALSRLPPRRAAVLIGGTSAAYTLTEQKADEICAHLLKLASNGVGVMLTFSRRTPKMIADRMSIQLAVDPNIYVWDGRPVGDITNPYFGMLGLADHILVTEDSTNMATDAAATGKPIYILSLKGGAAKFKRFHSDLEERGIARKFSGQLNGVPYRPLCETDRAAEEILARYAQKAPLALS